MRDSLNGKLNAIKMGEIKMCPLLRNAAKYNPDTLDLLKDVEAREYWLDCFENLVDKYVAHAVKNRGDDATVESRANQFKACYVEAIQKIRDDPLKHKDLSIRHLLDLNETCLHSQGFVDLWKNQKAIENKSAMERLNERLNEIDAIDNEEDKWTELCKGLLAGNMFDWGARAVSEILESDAQFGLHEALNRIQKRPWLIDGLDLWLNRIKGPPHKCAAVFVDNSGVDVILGVLPFIRQLLLRRTKVILCANSEPALNDITSSELQAVVDQSAKVCKTIIEALTSGDLIIMPSGQKGPCLDLRSLDSDLCSAIIENEVDLVIIEGMGRALHTNLNAALTCECLKMAVVKNPWLANRLGGQIFSVICRYEK